MIPKIIAFLKLLRWPNLLFIVLTQFLFQFAILNHIFLPTQHVSNTLFVLIVAASALIAAAGYVINDYFDINIDIINKPNRRYIENIFSRRQAILFHFFLTMLGLICTAYVSYNIQYWWLLLYNLVSVVLLVIYSTSLKRKNLYGNFLIALLTAYTIGVLFLIQLHILNAGSINNKELLNKLFRVTGAYMLFSFITTLIREAVKDLEDIEGDRKEGCRTMPIVWGVPVTKMYTGILFFITILLLAAITIYSFLLNYYTATIYVVVLLITPSIYCIFQLKKAQTGVAYAHISRTLKYIMLAGVFSMLFFLLS
jgi:4-hydroxybenzoate polyprenyltransferase